MKKLDGQLAGRWDGEPAAQ